MKGIYWTQNEVGRKANSPWSNAFAATPPL